MIDVPTNARDISYHFPLFGPARYADYAISEKDFILWAESKQYVPLHTIPNKGFGILQVIQTGPNQHDIVEHRIRDGLYYERMSAPDAGGHVAYDRQVGRAYYHQHSR